jgi:hypothetical protein
MHADDLLQAGIGKGCNHGHIAIDISTSKGRDRNNSAIMPLSIINLQST